MKTRRMLAVTAALAAGLASLAVGPAAAQFTAPLSPQSQNFVIVARTSANFIDEAGRTALANGAGKSAQSFARSAIDDQDAAVARMKGLADIAPLPTGRSALPAATTGALDFLFAPLDLAATSATNITGAPLASTPAGLPITATQQETLDKLQALNGRAFDRAYIISQRETYEALWAAYDNYARNGDDAALRDAAAQELPSIQRQRDRLKRL